VPILLRDIRFSLHQFWKYPDFFIAAVLSIALGIASTVIVFSLLNNVIFHPFPYRDAERVVEFHIPEKIEVERTPPVYREQIRQLRRAQSIEDIVEMDEKDLADTTTDFPLDTDAVFLSGNAFPFFGVPAMLGRTFLPSDAPEGQAPQPVVVLTYQYWQHRFNGNPAIIGQQLRLDNRGYTILGVMPRSFTWWDADLYIPLDTSDPTVHGYMTVLRIRPGFTKEQAGEEVRPIFQQMVREHPHTLLDGVTVQLMPINERFMKSLGKTLYVLFAVVLLLLLISCVNVSILLLARGATRRHEFAVRAAMGASAKRLISQLLTESILLGCAGAVLGLIATYFLTPFAASMLPWQLFPIGRDISVNGTVLVFCLAITVLASVCFGIIPAFQMAKPEVREIMQTSSRRLAGSVSGNKLHAILIGGQITLAMVLLSAAATAIQSFRVLLHADLGYTPDHVADFAIPVPSAGYTTWEGRANYFRELRDRVAKTPGVLSASLGVIGPPYSDWDFPMQILGRSAFGTEKANLNFVDSEFFRSLQVELLQGRLWDESETSRGARLAVVNQVFARLYFPNGNVIGQSVRVPDLVNRPPSTIAVNGSDQWISIIGVVGDVRNNGLDEPVKPEIYFPYSLRMINWVQIFVRTNGDPLRQEAAVRRQIANVNPLQVVSTPVVPLTERIQQQSEWARGHLVAVLSSVFSLLALVLASVGLFSVVSYSVAQRTNEFGIRMALGAQRGHILHTALRSIGISVGSGLFVGIVLSSGLRSFLVRWLGVTIQFPIMLVSAGILLIVAGVACIVPAVRGSMMQPMKALRNE
jgi:predicted permease